MKPRKTTDLRDLTTSELFSLLAEAQETYSNQKFQHALSQLQDTAYLRILRKDIARIITILSERERANQNG